MCTNERKILCSFEQDMNGNVVVCSILPLVQFVSELVQNILNQYNFFELVQKVSTVTTVLMVLDSEVILYLHCSKH